MMLAQEKMITRLELLCREDDRLVAAMLYGSFAMGEGDQYADIDCMLYFDDSRLSDVDPFAWLKQLAPVEMYYKNEFGSHVAIFQNLVRGEFHFDPASQMSSLADLQGLVAFPSVESAILVDKSGSLAYQLESLIGPPPDRDKPGEIRFLADSLINWTLFGLNVLARGETARAWELLRLIHDILLRLVRIKEGQIAHWITPTKDVEKEISPDAYHRLVRCSAALDRDQLIRAYRETWFWGWELVAELAQTHDLELPVILAGKIEDHFFE